MTVALVSAGSAVLKSVRYAVAGFWNAAVVRHGSIVTTLASSKLARHSLLLLSVIGFAVYMSMNTNRRQPAPATRPLSSVQDGMALTRRMYSPSPADKDSDVGVIDRKGDVAETVTAQSAEVPPQGSTTDEFSDLDGRYVPHDVHMHDGNSRHASPPQGLAHWAYLITLGIPLFVFWVLQQRLLWGALGALGFGFAGLTGANWSPFHYNFRCVECLYGMHGVKGEHIGPNVQRDVAARVEMLVARMALLNCLKVCVPHLLLT